MDYLYYVEEYGGTMGEDDFCRASRRAAAYLSGLTMEQSELPQWRNDKRVMDAICAMAEVAQKHESGGNIASETNGKASVTYDTSHNTSEQSEMYRTAELYLMSTGLLYRGLGGYCHVSLH